MADINVLPLEESILTIGSPSNEVGYGPWDTKGEAHVALADLFGSEDGIPINQTIGVWQNAEKTIIKDFCLQGGHTVNHWKPKYGDVTIDSKVTSDSNNAVSSKAVYDAINEKLNSDYNYKDSVSTTSSLSSLANVRKGDAYLVTADSSLYVADEKVTSVSFAVNEEGDDDSPIVYKTLQNNGTLTALATYPYNGGELSEICDLTCYIGSDGKSLLYFEDGGNIYVATDIDDTNGALIMTNTNKSTIADAIASNAIPSVAYDVRKEDVKTIVWNNRGSVGITPKALSDGLATKQDKLQPSDFSKINGKVIFGANKEDNIIIKGNDGSNVEILATEKVAKFTGADNKKYVTPVEEVSVTASKVNGANTNSTLYTYLETATINIEEKNGCETHYSTDGSDPLGTTSYVGNSFQVTGFNSDANDASGKVVTVKTCNKKYGEYSDTLSANVTVLRKVPTPTISIVSGTTDYDSSRTVEIDCALSGATIYYTTDGTDPTTSTTKQTYSSTTKIPLSASKTIKAYATKTNWSRSSDVASESVTVGKAKEIYFGFSSTTPTDVTTLGNVKSGSKYTSLKSGNTYTATNTTQTYMWFAIYNGTGITTTNNGAKTPDGHNFDFEKENGSIKTYTIGNYKVYRSEKTIMANTNNNVNFL